MFGGKSSNTPPLLETGMLRPANPICLGSEATCGDLFQIHEIEKRAKAPVNVVFLRVYP